MLHAQGQKDGSFGSDADPPPRRPPGGAWMHLVGDAKISSTFRGSKAKKEKDFCALHHGYCWKPKKKLFHVHNVFFHQMLVTHSCGLTELNWGSHCMWRIFLSRMAKKSVSTWHSCYNKQELYYNGCYHKQSQFSVFPLAANDFPHSCTTKYTRSGEVTEARM